MNPISCDGLQGDLGAVTHCQPSFPYSLVKCLIVGLVSHRRLPLKQMLWAYPVIHLFWEAITHVSLVSECLLVPGAASVLGGALEPPLWGLCPPAFLRLPQTTSFQESSPELQAACPWPGCGDHYYFSPVSLILPHLVQTGPTLRSPYSFAITGGY